MKTLDILLLGLAAAILLFAAVDLAQFWALIPCILIFIAMLVRGRAENRKEKENKEP